MFWPSPDDSVDSGVVVVCPVRHYTDDSFDVQKEMTKMRTEHTDGQEGIEQYLCQAEKQQTSCCLPEQCHYEVSNLTSSDVEDIFVLRHRRTSWSHHESPR